MSIFVTSDLHFCHNREFIYKPRGFSSVEEMNETIIQRYNETVLDDDTILILGDLMLGGNSNLGLDYIKRLKGHKVIIAGNHDTPNRRFLYQEELGLKVVDALTFKHDGYHFYASHYPTFTANLEKESLKQCTINLYGHTHQTSNFYNDIPFMYHCGVNSHDCYPVLLDEAIVQMKRKVDECKEYL